MTRAEILAAVSDGADLYRADLRGADLREAGLREADLRGANLHGAAGGLMTAITPSGQAILTPTPAGWHLQVGCWSGTIEALRDLIAQDDDWPEARGPEVARRRPILAAVADLATAHAVGWGAPVWSGSWRQSVVSGVENLGSDRQADGQGVRIG